MVTINCPRAAWFLPDGNSRSVTPEAGKPSELPGTPEMSRKSGLRPSSSTAPRKGSSEVRGRSLLRLRVTVHAIRAVLGRDVAEPVFLCARYSCCRLLGCEPTDQLSKVLHELFVHSVRRYEDRVVAVGDLATELTLR